MAQVTIIGLGLIGGSIAKGLSAKGLKGLEVHAYDEDFGVLRDAEKQGVIARGHRSVADAVRDASMVVLATPVVAMAELLDEIAPHLQPGATVTDTASTKSDVMSWAERSLPESVNFVGGHPMAGKEDQGFRHSSGDLFEGAAWCICPAPRAEESAINSVIGMVSLLGANPVFIDPDEHDQYVAAVSHLPLVMAVTLFNMCRTSSAWEDMGVLAASGFRDSTRLASGDPLMARDIVLTNPDGIKHWIDRFIEELRATKEVFDRKPEEIFQFFADNKIERDIYVETAPRKRVERVVEAMPTGREEMTRLFLGSWVMDKAKDVPAQFKVRETERLREQLNQRRERGERDR